MRSRRVAKGWALLVALALSAMPASAEVSVDIVGPDIVKIIILGVTEGPDPFGMWVPVRQISAERILNPSGAARGDGRPDTGDWSSKVPIVTWAYRAGTDFDIAVAEWIGLEWSPPEFLTDEVTDEMDPRLYVAPDGAVHLVWWVKQTGKVYLATRQADSNVWLEPVVVTPPGTYGRRPSVAVWHGNLFVAYERDANSTGTWKDVIVAQREGDGDFALQTVVRLQTDEPTMAMVHSFAGVLWVDWRSGAEEFSYARGWGSSWTPALTLDWSDFSWTGTEQAHLTIRSMLLQPVENDPVGQNADADEEGQEGLRRTIDGAKPGAVEVRKSER